MSDAVPPPLPPARSTSSPRMSAAAIASLVLGLLSFTCGSILTAIPAVICGHAGYSRIRKSNGALGGKNFAIAGLILGYIGIALGLMGIPLLVGMIKSERERVAHLRVERKEITSTDGSVALRIPGTWVALPDLNKSAVLQAGSKSDDVYAIVLSDAKADLANVTLEKHHQFTRDAMLGKLSASSATTATRVVIDGKPALQDEISGTQNRVAVVFLHTTVDDGDHFQQLLAWAVRSHWEAQKGLLHEVTDSFRRLK